MPVAESLQIPKEGLEKTAQAIQGGIGSWSGTMAHAIYGLGLWTFSLLLKHFNIMQIVHCTIDPHANMTLQREDCFFITARDKQNTRPWPLHVHTHR